MRIPALCARFGAAALLVAVAGCAAPRGGSVAVLTDYGARDHYAGVIVANILRTNPDARIFTITHEVEPYNIAQGAFLLEQAASEFPVETVILGVVDPGASAGRAPIVVVTAAGRVLVGPDNGLFSPLIRHDGGIRAVHQISNVSLMRLGCDSGTVRAQNVFAPVAGHLSRGVAPAAVGPRVDRFVQLDLPEAQRDAAEMRGAVIHVDRFGNVLTNLPGEWLDDAPPAARLEVVAQVASREAIVIEATVGRAYGDVPSGEYIVLSNETGQIEVARNQASAADALGVHAGDGIRLRRK